MALLATCYARFSSAEQSASMSLERQWKITKKVCVDNGWDYDERRNIADEGVSAFSGSNRQEGGGLFEFERKAAAGHFKNGHVLVVEHLDRISREGYDAVLKFINGLTAAGVTVATKKDIYRPFQRLSLADVMKVLIEAEVAYEESEKKSFRQLELWEKKLAEARAGNPRAITRLIPSWIVVDTVSRGMSLHPNRADVVREIFEWCADGFGAPAIVRKLNERGEETWGEYTKTDEKKGHVAGQKRAKAGWMIGQILRLFDDASVIGEYQPMKRARSDKLATVKGERIIGYYPAAIDPDLWARAQAARTARRGTGGTLWSRQVNLFSGLATCAKCGGRMDYVATAKKGTERKGTSGTRKPIVIVAKEDISYLQCSNARRSHGCDAKKRFRYQRIEEYVLDRVLHLTLDNSHFEIADRVAILNVDIAAIERSVEEQGQRLARLVDSYSRTGSEAVETSMLALEKEMGVQKALLPALRAQLLAAQGEVSPEEHQRRIGEVRQLIGDDDPDIRLEARRKLHQALSKIIRLVCYVEREESGMESYDEADRPRVLVEVLERKMLFLIDMEGKDLADYDGRYVFATKNPKDEGLREALRSMESNPVAGSLALQGVLNRSKPSELRRPADTKISEGDPIPF